MHISDVLPAGTLVGGFLIAGTWIGISARKLTPDEMPKIAVMSAAFFIASLIHVNLGGASVHLLLHGLVGIILGIYAPLAIGIALLFQFLFFGHGGFSTIGVNTVLMGSPAVLAGWGFRILGKSKSEGWQAGLAAGLTAATVALSAILAAFALLTAGEDLETVAGFLLVGHIPVMAIEAVVAGLVVRFLHRVKPELLPR